jgi:hypothetical protein
VVRKRRSGPPRTSAHVHESGQSPSSKSTASTTSPTPRAALARSSRSCSRRRISVPVLEVAASLGSSPFARHRPSTKQAADTPRKRSMSGSNINGPTILAASTSRSVGPAVLCDGKGVVGGWLIKKGGGSTWARNAISHAAQAQQIQHNTTHTPNTTISHRQRRAGGHHHHPLSSSATKRPPPPPPMPACLPAIVCRQLTPHSAIGMDRSVDSSARLSHHHRCCTPYKQQMAPPPRRKGGGSFPTAHQQPASTSSGGSTETTPLRPNNGGSGSGIGTGSSATTTPLRSNSNGGGGGGSASTTPKRRPSFIASQPQPKAEEEAETMEKKMNKAVKLGIYVAGACVRARIGHCRGAGFG